MSLASSADDIVHPWKFLTYHFPVDKQQGAQRLILCGRRDLALHREKGEECLNSLSVQLIWMALAVKQDELTGPVDVGLFRLSTVVTHPNG